MKHAPKMRVACLYDEQTDLYKYFTVKEVKSLISYLKKADEVISFNGNIFDILVLRKHYSLKGNIPIRGKHIDMWEIFRKRAGYWVGLDKAVKVNFNERKHTSGRKMKGFNIEKLKVACRSDVDQTYRLWKLYKNVNLKCRTQKNENEKNEKL